MKRVTDIFPWLLAAPLLAGLSGCSAQHYRKSADKEVYRAIARKTPLVPNMDPDFTVEQTDQMDLLNLPLADEVPEYLGAEAERERLARVLSLERALEIAVRRNRAYQSRKERLYLVALSFTLARHQFRPIFSAGGSARIIGETQQAVDFIVDPVTQEPRVILSDSLVEQRRLTADADAGASWLIRDVGLISAAFTTDFVRFITGDPRVFSSSRVSGALLRPLWRNAGFKQQIENLTQAERNLLYDLRSFAQFRKTFSVQVASAFYAVLGQRDTVRNAYLNLQSSRRNAERTRELAQEGRVTQADLGRLEQQVLAAESAWINALRNYQQSLDDFKLLQLSIPVDTNIVLDNSELEMLEIEHPEIAAEEAVEIALAARLDFQNAKDAYEDAGRQVELAVNFLRPQVDLVASAGFNSPQDQSGDFVLPDIERYNWSAGLNVDLPLDRKGERNVYRAALIGRKQAARNIEQEGDEITLEVRENWRSLDQARRNYEISGVGVDLAERRVEEQDLLAELGRARALDQVDAQNDLSASKNQLTQALVGHTIARLRFWASMGILYIKDNGQWKGVNDVERR